MGDMVAAQLSWREKQTGAPGGNCEKQKCRNTVSKKQSKNSTKPLIAATSKLFWIEMKKTQMKRILTACILLLICLTACTNRINDEAGKFTNTLKEYQGETDNDSINYDLQSQFAQIASAAGDRVGVAAVMLESDDSAYLGEGEHFPMQSVYKLPIAMAVLKQIDEGKIKLDQKVRIEKSDFVGKAQHSPIRDKNPNGAELPVTEILRFAVSESDGTASDALLKLIGGAPLAQEYLTQIGITELKILNTEKELGQDQTLQYKNWTSPAEAVNLLRALYNRQGLSEQSRTLLLKFMTESTPGAKRLKGLLPANAVVAHKTGTSGTINGITAATNDIGIVTMPNGKHFIIAIFVSDSPTDETTREATIAKIAKAAWDKWSN
jgi:beta-lactamase class A